MTIAPNPGFMSISWSSGRQVVAMFLLLCLVYAEVLKENACHSRTIEIQATQKVVDTELYGIVRHPLYSATLLMFLSMPLMPGSPLTVVITLAYISIIALRMRSGLSTREWRNVEKINSASSIR